MEQRILFEDLWSKGNTIIIVTHEEEIAQNAHRIIKIRDGLIADDYLSEKGKLIAEKTKQQTISV